MEDDQFEKLMAVNEETQAIAKETQAVQRKQEETLNGFGRALESQGDSIAKHGETLNGFQQELTKIDTNVDNLKDRAKEDRENDTNRSDRMEDKLGKVHDRVNDVPKLRGEFENHIDDNHATKAAETATAIDEHTKDGHAKVAHETRSDLDEHMINNDRHSGEARGDSMSTKAKVGYGAGGTGLLGALIYLIDKLIQG